ncbi:hypothetical protein B0J13DRAFT_306452 [Dactylonectria estremocensis]|uniref:Cell surface protein n=1 Tax=Dactylonectria estremocensis TaxID=1079267 RepID=A0A9P9J8L7_9HYPO|nr:hypothetical protein B0J13DRAFT_306452 [Dactylonectria estremocensis]
MSSIVNKVKEALHSDKDKTSAPEGTHGTHNSRAANAADPRIDSDRDHRAAHTGTTHTGTHTGTHNTIGDNRPLGTTSGTATRTDGPHNSNLLNKADPRVDSDRDHSTNLGANPHGTATTSTYGSSNTHSSALGGNHGALGGNNTTHSSALGGNHGGLSGNNQPLHQNTDSRPIGGTDGPATRTDGPHNSNLLNKADPRVDSDRDHSKNLGANPHGTSGTNTGAYGSSNTHSSALGGNHGVIGGHNTTNTGGYSGGIQEGSVGTHNSRVANAADPRIDSDLDGSRTLGSNTQGTHTGAHSGAFGSSTGTHGTSTTHGTSHGTSHGGLGSSTAPHGTHAGGLGSSTTHNTSATGGAYGSGPAPNTVGPHKSDLLNKVDPRVDSDLDGSKTVGGDKTFQRSNDTASAYAHKDPTDAAQVPPSVLQQHIGAPTIAHDDHSHDRARRHSVSHQDDHRGL